MNQSLTRLQTSVLTRLKALGLDDLADRAHLAWHDGRPLREGMQPFEKATLEGARLDPEFDRANSQASQEAR